MNNIDVFIQNYFISTRTPFITDLMYSVSVIFNWSSYFLVLVIFTSVIIFLAKGFGKLILFISSISITTVIVYLLKSVFDINRPSGAVIDAFGQSFPSYHATISAVFFIILIYIFKDYFNGFFRKVFGAFSFFAIATVSFSRVYLGVHWFSDVIFGVVLGVFLACIFILAFKKIESVHKL